LSDGKKAAFVLLLVCLWLRQKRDLNQAEVGGFDLIGSDLSI
jgi:hypothetical protein